MAGGYQTATGDALRVVYVQQPCQRLYTSCFTVFRRFAASGARPVPPKIVAGMQDAFQIWNARIPALLYGQKLLELGVALEGVEHRIGGEQPHRSETAASRT